MVKETFFSANTYKIFIKSINMRHLQILVIKLQLTFSYLFIYLFVPKLLGRKLYI